MGRVSAVEGVEGPVSIRIRAHGSEILAALREVSRAMWSRSSLDPGLRELTRLHVASLNQCPRSLALGYVPGKESGLAEDKIRRLPDCDSDAFTAREKAAPRVAPAMIRNPKATDDAFFAEMKACFNEAGLVDPWLSVAMFRELALFNVVFGAEPEPCGTEYAV